VKITAAQLRLRLQQLAKAAISNTASGFRVEQTEDVATVYVYSVIGGWWGDISAEAFAKEIAAITAKTIHLRINSPGGDVFEARAMCTALRNHPAQVIAYVDGLAASAASYLMLASEKVVMADGAFVMIHNAWGLVMGNKHDLRETAELLDKIDQSIIADYKKKTKNDTDWAALMDAETWFDAKEAKAIGLVDEIDGAAEEQAEDAQAKAWNLDAYDKAPAALKAAAQTKPANEPQFNRAAAERRLALLLRTGS
jgi:ATP-dependent Clp protease protease subunit